MKIGEGLGNEILFLDISFLYDEVFQRLLEEDLQGRESCTTGPARLTSRCWSGHLRGLLSLASLHDKGDSHHGLLDSLGRWKEQLF